MKIFLTLLTKEIVIKQAKNKIKNKQKINKKLKTKTAEIIIWMTYKNAFRTFCTFFSY